MKKIERNSKIRAVLAANNKDNRRITLGYDIDIATNKVTYYVTSCGIVTQFDDLGDASSYYEREVGDGGNGN